VFEPRSLPELSQPYHNCHNFHYQGHSTPSVWDELDYLLDSHRVFYGERIVSLRGVCKTVRVSLSTDVGVKYAIRLYFLHHFETPKFFCGPSIPYFHASLERSIACYTMVFHSGECHSVDS